MSCLSASLFVLLPAVKDKKRVCVCVCDKCLLSVLADIGAVNEVKVVRPYSASALRCLGLDPKHILTVLCSNQDVFTATGSIACLYANANTELNALTVMH